MRVRAMEPDPWQADLLRSSDSATLVLCARQAGKTSAVAALLLNEALLNPGSLCLVLSHTERQSGEFLLRVHDYYRALERPVVAVKETALQLWLRNGSRIIGLPENEGGVRNYAGVRLLVIDEAARVADALYLAVRPMLSVSRGRLIALSTPFGQRGWFFEAWEQGGAAWRRIKITADECPRYDPRQLAEDRQAMGERWFRQEYYCSFEAAVDTVFDPEAIAASMRADVRPLWS
jgi:hypothetical protein